MAALRFRELHKEIAVKIAVAAGLCVAFFYFVARPVSLESATLQQEIRSSQARLELFEDVRRLNDQLAAEEQPFFEVNARSALVGKVSDMANKKKIDVQTLTPRTATKGTYVHLRIELSGQASYPSILAFLKDIETLEPPLSVTELSLVQQTYVRTREETGGRLQMKLSLETYLLKQPREKKQP